MVRSDDEHVLWYSGVHGSRGALPQYADCSPCLTRTSQILLEQRYGRAVDWWAFGVLMYEMLLGQSPFRGDDEDEIFDAILEDEPLYPITMPRDAVSVLQKVRTWYCSALPQTIMLTVVDTAPHTRPHTATGLWKERCGGDQETSVLQGCEL